MHRGADVYEGAGRIQTAGLQGPQVIARRSNAALD
jgi:hypothetical protein